MLFYFPSIFRNKGIVKTRCRYLVFVTPFRNRGMVKPNTVLHCFISYQTIAGALRITIILVNKVCVFMMQYIIHYREKQYT